MFECFVPSAKPTKLLTVSGAELSDGLYAKMRTNQGNIIIKLAFDKAPLTVSNFVGLAEGTKHSNIQTFLECRLVSLKVVGFFTNTDNG
jgi:hypothetical protein